jgi:hypothetical protein
VTQALLLPRLGGLKLYPVLRPVTPLKSAVLTLAAAVLVTGLSGCAQFDKALGQQWVVVQFAPNTTVATAKHVTSVCSHVPNLRLEGKVKPTTAQAGVVDSVNYNARNASAAELAELEQCLSKFPAIVQGFTEQDQGDN